jgi:hypothetical protein
VNIGRRAAERESRVSRPDRGSSRRRPTESLIAASLCGGTRRRVPNTPRRPARAQRGSRHGGEDREWEGSGASEEMEKETIALSVTTQKTRPCDQDFCAARVGMTQTCCFRTQLSQLSDSSFVSSTVWAPRLMPREQHRAVCDSAISGPAGSRDYPVRRGRARGTGDWHWTRWPVPGSPFAGTFRSRTTSLVRHRSASRRAPRLTAERADHVAATGDRGGGGSEEEAGSGPMPT